MFLCFTVPIPFTGQRLAGELVSTPGAVALRALPADCIFLTCLAELSGLTISGVFLSLQGTHSRPGTDRETAADSTTGLKLGQYGIQQELVGVKE